MLKNYIRVALRSIFRNKLTAFINIAGLSLAMTCSMLIFLFITDELSYDRHSSKADRTYRVTRDFLNNDGGINLRLANVAPPIGPLLQNDFSEIETMARTINLGINIGLEENGETKNFTEESFFAAEPGIVTMFDVEVIAGDKATALVRPFTVMLSETTARKLFANNNPVGKRLLANDQFDLEVTGVYHDFPRQSHWHPDYLLAFSSMEDKDIYGRERLETNWGNNAFGTYIVLEESANPVNVEANLPDFLNTHYGGYAKTAYGAPADFVASKTTTLSLQKVTDIHLRSHRDDELEVNGNMDNVYMMGVIGLFIVLIACFNFVNLSTARATKRAKEAGMRKVVGAFKSQLVLQYLSESLLTSFFALAIALGLSLLVMDWLNRFTGKSLHLDFIANLPMFFGMIGFAVVVGILAGLYPAFVISGFKPVSVLKGQHGSPRDGALRKSLVVVQFSISIILLIATAITFQQLEYLNSRNLGYDKDQVITIPYYDGIAKSYDAFYNELISFSGIRTAGRSSRIPTGRLLDSNGPPSITRGDSLVNSSVTTKFVRVDHEFFKTYDVEFLAGRDFSKVIVADDTSAFVINEAAAKAYGWKTVTDGLGKDFNYGGRNGKLIGIVKDFHFESLHQQIIPLVFFIGGYNHVSIKIAGSDMQRGIQHVEKVMKEHVPNRPFSYSFLSDRYSNLYEDEQKQGQLFTIFSGLAIFIACLGLFGLATFNTLQRVKEIGIRKVLGASVPNILTLLSREIVVLILVANLVAWPLAWYGMTLWLDSFAYHIDMSVAVYFLAACAAIVLALFIVSTQTVRAAMTNPANTLKYE